MLYDKYLYNLYFWTYAFVLGVERFPPSSRLGNQNMPGIQLMYFLYPLALLYYSRLIITTNLSGSAKQGGYAAHLLAQKSSRPYQPNRLYMTLRFSRSAYSGSQHLLVFRQRDFPLEFTDQEVAGGGRI